MPLFHTAGNVVDQLSMLVVGGTVIKAISFDAAKMLELIDHEKATVMDAVPTMIIAMLQEPRFLAGEFDAVVAAPGHHRRHVDPRAADGAGEGADGAPSRRSSSG